jgi:hypothetical protein
MGSCIFIFFLKRLFIVGLGARIKMITLGGWGNLEGQNVPQSSSFVLISGLNTQLPPDVDEDDDIINVSGKDYFL